MKRRVFVVLVVALSPFVMKAGTHFLPSIKHTYIDNPTTVQQSDTIVADLEDLEAMIGDSVLHEDTVYYGPVKDSMACASYWIDVIDIAEITL